MACPEIPKITDPITDNSSTVFLNIKYPQSLIKKLNPKVSCAKVTQGLQADLTDSLVQWTKTLYACENQKKIRFVVILDEVNSCTASFHLTTDSEVNFISLPPTPVIVITVKGRISQLENDADSLTFAELEEVYSTLLGILTGPKYNLSIQDILIDRIEMISPEEKCLQESLIKQKSPLKKRNQLEKELEQKQKRIEELESEIRALTNQVSTGTPPADYAMINVHEVLQNDAEAKPKQDNL